MDEQPLVAVIHSSGRIDKIKQLIRIAGLTIPILLVFIGIVFNIYASSQINFQYKYGTFNQRECGNEYLEIDTPNYQIYDLFTNKPHFIQLIVNSFILLQVGWITFITSIYILVSLDLISMKDITPFKRLFHLGIIGVFGMLFVSYLITFSINIKNRRKFLTAIRPNIVNTFQTYSLFKFYLPTILWILPVIYLAITNSADTISKYSIFIALYVLIIAIEIQLNASVFKLLSSFEEVYLPIVSNDDGLEKMVEHILKDTSGANIPITQPPPPDHTNYQLNYQNAFKHYLMKNIKSRETTDGDSFVLTDKEGSYWKYLLHQNGNELKDLLDNYSNDSNSKALTAYITQIRKNLRTLRNDTKLSESVTNYSDNIQLYSIAIFMVILFAIYHFIYTHLNNPVFASVMTGTIVLLAVIIGPTYGFITNVMNKSKNAKF